MCVIQVFHDIDPNFVVDDETLYVDKLLGKGAFGQVYAGELRRVGTVHVLITRTSPYKSNPKFAPNM